VILLDSNAGAPLHPKVMAALSDFLREQAEGEAALGNPSSTHAYGRRASAMVERAREAMLRTLNAAPSEWAIVFTSGGTEANQLAIRGYLERRLREGGGRPAWALSPLDHHCVLDLAEEMEARGVRIVRLEARDTGEVVGQPGASIDLVSAMRVNNETGIVQERSPLFPVDVTSHIQSSPNLPQTPLWHTDFVAGWGKTDLDLSRPGSPDLVAIAGHKVGALSGVGALVHRRSIALDPLIRGKQQSGARGGTENLVGIRSLLAVAENWDLIRAEASGLAEMRDEFERRLVERHPAIRITGKGLPRAPQVSHFVVPGLKRSISLVEQLDLRGFAVSSGSACSSAVPEPSHVLTAMGIGRVDALNAVRVSLHPGTRREDLTGLVEALDAILSRYESRQA
jgi:cysteine desulfurase